MALPNFFIAGAPKAGTTALHAALARHPELYLSAVKEPKFFLTNGPPPAQGGPGDAKTYAEHVWRRRDYEELFAPAPSDTLRGESTPFYLYSRRAQMRIKGLIPDAKMIVVLRDPIERAHSNWTHLWSAGLDPIDDFVRACGDEDRRVSAGWADFWHYKRLGLYGEQLKHLYSAFPPDQVLLLRYRQLVEQPAATLNRICAFLGVSQGLICEIPRENVTAHPDQTRRHQYLSKLLRTGSAMSSRLPRHPAMALIDRLEGSLQQGAAPRRPLTWEQRQALIPYFEADVRLLEDLTDEDFTSWLLPRQESGGLVGARPAGQRQARNGRPRAF
ncbi:MAG: sulfotransferase [Actinobacteria bacterium]|nr:sulfotransferase [Actinomycetota bacterium]